MSSYHSASSTLPALPTLHVIPATPLAFSSAAESAKQLGHAPPAAPTPAPAAVPEEPPVRPLLAHVPDTFRESILHPWWRPKRAARALPAHC